ncbi:hypothetical protein TSOC_010884 [Tetrabaena socialis]|uniref:EF-hand domain-containing protein n=1 Tax=Tetrabaena socialis TaxID=47790 RepID=A0A2J7ZS88_9CHLO|nr:hypothetical protein TSOC_010884 [Tetrabaena socialis]|eukprot:PNH03100.1 hypothetical protein TSOC_010884 [Tetrabaena socialis]
MALACTTPPIQQLKPPTVAFRRSKDPMAQRALQGRLRGASQPSSARRPTDWGQPFSRAQPQQQPRTEQPQLASQLLAAGVALGITLGGFGAVQPAVAATAAAAPTAAFTSLADIMRSNYAFVDEDKNGVITKEELVKQSQSLLLPLSSPTLSTSASCRLDVMG